MGDAVLTPIKLEVNNAFLAGNSLDFAALTDELSLVMYFYQPTGSYKLVVGSRTDGFGNSVSAPVSTALVSNFGGLASDVIALDNGDFICFFLTVDQHFNGTIWLYETRLVPFTVRVNGTSLSLPTVSHATSPVLNPTGSLPPTSQLSGGPSRWIMQTDVYFGDGIQFTVVTASIASSAIAGWAVESWCDLSPQIKALGLVAEFPPTPYNGGNWRVGMAGWARYDTGDKVAAQAAIQYDWDDGSTFGVAAQYRGIFRAHRASVGNWLVDDLTKRVVTHLTTDPGGAFFRGFHGDRSYGPVVSINGDGVATAAVVSVDESGYKPAWYWEASWDPGAAFDAEGRANFDYNVAIGVALEFDSVSGAGSTWLVDGNSMGYCASGPHGERSLAEVNRSDLWAPFFETQYTLGGEGVGVFFKGNPDMSTYFWMDRHGLWYRDHGHDTQVYAWPHGPASAAHPLTLLFDLEGPFMEIYADFYDSDGVYHRHDLRVEGGNSPPDVKWFGYGDPDSSYHFLTDQNQIDALCEWAKTDNGEVRFGFFWDVDVVDPATRIPWADGSQIDDYGWGQYVELVTATSISDPIDVTPPDGLDSGGLSYGLDYVGNLRMMCVGAYRSGHEEHETLQEFVVGQAGLQTVTLLSGNFAFDPQLVVWDSSAETGWHKDHTGVTQAIWYWPYPDPPFVTMVFVDESANGALKGAFVSFEP